MPDRGEEKAVSGRREAEEGPVCLAAAGTAGPAVVPPLSAGRLPHLDDIKTLLIAGITTLVAIVLLGAMVLSTDPLGLTEEDWLGGWGLPALAAALLEGVIVIAAPVWVLSFAQRRLDGTGPIRRAMARGSYAAFMLQGPVIVGLELAFRPAPLPGDLKAVLVACLGIAVSFTLAYPLVTRTPLRRAL